MKPTPHLVYWEITKRCNLRCAHCRAIPQASASSPDELTLAEGIRLIDAIAEGGRPILVMTGGEPLLRGDVFDLATYGKWRGLTMALATNGTLVTRRVARQIVDAGIKRVSINLDGPDAETHDQFRLVPGTFDGAVDGFIHLKELGMELQVNTTVTTNNREALGGIYEMVRKLGADAWHLFLLVPAGCGLEIARDAQFAPREVEAVLCWMEDFSQQETMEIRAACAPHAERIRLQRSAIAGAEAEAKVKQPLSIQFPPKPQPEPQPDLTDRRGCMAGTGICFISHRGEVFPCGYLPIKAGDIRQRPFVRIWEEAPIFADLRDPDRLMGKCGACEYRVVCGGCRARAFAQGGHYLREEPMCNYQSLSRPPTYSTSQTERS